MSSTSKQRPLWFRIITNKYVIATVVFAAVILFFDEYNLMVTRRAQREVSQLQAEEQTLREAIVHDSLSNATLRHSMEAKERFARENYYMKRPNEDIYVIR